VTVRLADDHEKTLAVLAAQALLSKREQQNCPVSWMTLLASVVLLEAYFIAFSIASQIPRYLGSPRFLLGYTPISQNPAQR
jgi:hypothetical protein